MRKRWKTILAVMAMMTMVLAACQAATPEPTEVPPTEAPTEEMAVTPSVSVKDQTVEGGQVTVPSATIDGPGWVVIHADQDGGPGPVVGYAAVSDGENGGVTVDIDTEMATTTLYAMLHTDSGEEGTYEFPDGDPPVKAEGNIVVKPFQAKSGDDGADKEVEVEVVDTSYDPVELEVPVDTAVVWTSTGSLPHTVTADDGTFDSGNMSSGDTFKFTFEEPGSYPYYCTYHGSEGGGGMSGVITVTEGSGEDASMGNDGNGGYDY